MQQELAEAEEGDNAEVAGEDGGSVSAPPEGNAIVELWPFAFNTAYWHTIIEGLLGGERTSVIAILSPSAHPGSWLASRRLAQEVFVCTRRCSTHARRHALNLYNELRRKDLAPSNSQEATTTQAATAPPGVIRISAASTPQDVLEAYDVSPGQSWRDGLNLNQLAGEAFNAQASRLVGSQLETHGLAISAVDTKSGRGLEASRLLRDGEALPASALFFDTEAMLNVWLGHPGNEKYRDRIVSIAHVQKQGSPVTVFAVLIGAVQFVNAYCGIRRGPNAKLVFWPARGFNEGALELQIATRNGAGIAKGSPVLIDYGLQDVFVSGPGGGGNISGALAALFEQQKRALPQEAAQHQAEEQEAAAADAETQAAAAAAELKRKAEEEAQEAEVKRRKKEEAEAQAKKRAEEEARVAGVRGNVEKEGTLIHTLASPSSELRLIENILALVSLESSNKKVAKNAVLTQWGKNVSMTSKPGEGLAWSARPTDNVLIKETGGVMSFKKAMKDQYKVFGQIFGYEAFVAGTMPKELKPVTTSKQYRLDFTHDSFKSSHGAITKAIEAGRQAEKCQCVWIVRGDNDKKWVRPCGIAIVSNTQIILEPGTTFRL